MSNIYIQEPPTSGKVLLKTSVGDIDVELWTREAPKACRNFIQLCLEGYYDGTIFHRVVKEFIVQGGDPNGDGSGGDSIYGQPFKDEFHTRLRFCRRGLVAMANAGKDDNGSQFFFTMAATPELQNKHTLFGKVTGETVYNMLKLEDGLIGPDERPHYPNKILRTEVLINPFTDIVPRVVIKEEPDVKEKKKEKKTGVKNFKLLSFGEEAEEDEEQVAEANVKYAGKSKSTHDILDDPKLSALPAVETEEDSNKREISEADLHKEELENIRKKLKPNESKKKIPPSETIIKTYIKIEDDDDEVEEYYLGKDKEEEKKKRMEDIQREIRELKKDYHDNKKKHVVEAEKVKQEDTKRTSTLKEYDDTLTQYAEKQKLLPKKGASRQDFTLEMLKKFQAKLDAAKEKAASSDSAERKEPIDEDEEADNGDESWLAHKLSFADNVPVLARDANTKDDNWYEIDDPRNPLNKRRRGESKKSSNKSHHRQGSSSSSSKR